MADIRKLKKEIKLIAAELIAEAEVFIKFHPETDRKNGDAIITGIRKKEQSLIYEINHLKNSGDVKLKVYYGKIIEKVKKEMIPLLDKIGDTAQK